jgi:hypothetical protein
LYIAGVSRLRKYRPRAERFVVAVQLRLDTPGFTYRKWGAEQRCKRGDWLVDNGGDVYTVDADSFAKTYREERPGIYVKTTPVWAEVAGRAGSIATKEGATHYEAEDYLVFNNEDRSDGYAVARERFESMYEPAE